MGLERKLYLEGISIDTLQARNDTVGYDGDGQEDLGVLVLVLKGEQRGESRGVAMGSERSLDDESSHHF